MVMQGEVDDERRHRQSSQLSSRNHAVVAICLHPPSQGKSEENQHRRNRASDEAEPGMTLPNVVKQRSHDDIILLDTTCLHHRRSMMAMTLVGNTLSEKELRSLGSQPLHDLIPFRGVEWPGKRNVEETFEQMGRRIRQLETDLYDAAFDLHSTHRIEAGRNARRSAWIWAPQLAHVP